MLISSSNIAVFDEDKILNVSIISVLSFIIKLDLIRLKNFIRLVEKNIEESKPRDIIMRIMAKLKYNT